MDGDAVKVFVVDENAVLGDCDTVIHEDNIGTDGDFQMAEVFQPEQHLPVIVRGNNGTHVCKEHCDIVTRCRNTDGFNWDVCEFYSLNET